MVRSKFRFFLFTAGLLVNCICRAQTFDLYDHIETKAPTVIFIHGGAWLGGDKSQYHSLGEAFNRDGLCIAIMDYRLAPAAKHPAPVDDLQIVIDKMTSAPSKKCDNKKIFLVGHSAGAHMLAFWSTLQQNPAVKGLIGLEGIYDLPKLVTHWPSYKDWFVVPEFGQAKNWEAASPARQKIKSEARWFLIHSAKDELVDLAQSEDFKATLDAQKKSAEYLQVETETHFGVIEAITATQSNLRRKIVAFIKKEN